MEAKREVGLTGDVVKPGACLHPKMLRLADLLLPHTPGLPGAYATDVARARMDDLWNWFWGRYVKGEFRDGRLTGMGPSGLAQAARWFFDPSAFVEAAVTAGFLSRDQDGVLRVHDHEDHLPGWVRQALKDASRGSARGKSTGDARGDSTGGAPVDSPVRSMESLSLSLSLSSSLDPSLPPSLEAEKGSARPVDAGSASKGKAPRTPTARKPLSESEGLAGSLARRWRSKYGVEPEWGSAASVLNLLGQAHPQAEIEAAFDRYLAKGDQYVIDNRHPPGLFRSQYDRWAIAAPPSPSAATSKYSGVGQRVDVSTQQAAPQAAKIGTAE